MPQANVDQIAGYLQHLGAIGRAMPPAWRHAGISQPVCGPEGQHVGRMLPGRGLYLDVDAKALGIRRPLRNVVQRSRMWRALDRLADDRGSIATRAALLAAMTGGKAQTISFVNVLSGLASNVVWMDSYADAATPNLYTTNPGAALDQTSAGALNGAMTAPTGSDTAYLTKFGYGYGGGGTAPNSWSIAVLVDSLVGIGGLSADTTSTTTITSAPALTRYTSGAGVMLGLFAQSNSLPTTSTTATVSYTNQAGTSGQSTTLNIDGSVNIGAALPMLSGASVPWAPLQGSDYGVQTVASVTLTGTVGVSGDTFAVLLFYPLTFLSLSSAQQDFFEYEFACRPEGPIPLQVSSGNLGCLSLMRFAPSNSPTGGPNVLSFSTVRG